MATSLLLLLDDIASVLDDVALMSKMAAKKTAGVLGDDLALNAQQVSGVRADRELPVVWAVARGSLLNKAILVPAALAISAWAPWLITPLLMLGGAYLCFEGVEKLAQRWLHSPARAPAGADPVADLVAGQGAHPKAETPQDLPALERDKVKGAVRTDFILSAEIVAITLGTVAAAPLLQQFSVLAGIALLMTVGVYGLVAGIVKLDDLGLWLARPSAPGWQQGIGRLLLAGAPLLMKGLSVVGTAAMFLVGGGIVSHGWPALQTLIDAQSARAGAWGAALLPLLADLLVGLVVGAVALAAWTLLQRLAGPRRAGVDADVDAGARG